MFTFISDKKNITILQNCIMINPPLPPGDNCQLKPSILISFQGMEIAMNIRVKNDI